MGGAEGYLGLGPCTPGQTYYLKWHELCVCSGTGFYFCLSIKSLVQDTGLVSLHVKEHGDLVHGKPCSQCVVGEADRQTCVLGRPLKTTFAIWPEKRLAHEVVRLQTNMIAMLLKRTVILEEGEYLSFVYFGNYWSNTRRKPHAVTESISGVTEIQ